MDENQISYAEIDKEIEERAAAARKKLPHDIFDIVEFFVIAFSVILILATVLFRQAVVYGGSMENTLSSGDRLIISNFFYTPKTGDVVVVQLEDEITESYPMQLTKGEAVVKRVIATEGQRVRVSAGVVYVDDVPLSEDYVLLDGHDQRATMEEITVSEGHVFLMGDHRNKSLDSRWFGEVDERTILGKALFRIYPFNALGGVD